MSRIPEYRAWDKKRNIYGQVLMLEVNNSDHYKNANFGHTGRVSLFNLANEEDCGFWGSWIEFVDLEQWTGLFDKNKKKIFEGDIVNVKALCDNIYMVANQETIDEVAFSNGYFYVKGIASTIYPDDMELEVWGNIHENSDLIGNDE